MPKTVLILSCLANDYDGQMKAYAQVMKKKKKDKGCDVTVINFNNYSSLRAQPFRELCFVGHHKFFDEARAAIPLAKRTIGGHPISEVAAVPKHALWTRKVITIKFYCCESATNIDTTDRNDGGAAKVRLDFRLAQSRLVASLLGQGRDHQVSTIAYFAQLLFQESRRKQLPEGIKVQGFEGYGYIDEDNPRSRTFHSRYMGEYRAILTAKDNLESARSVLEHTENPKKKKPLQNRIQGLSTKIAEMESAFEVRIKEKASAHKIQFILSANSQSHSDSSFSVSSASSLVGKKEKIEEKKSSPPKKPSATTQSSSKGNPPSSSSTIKKASHSDPE